MEKLKQDKIPKEFIDYELTKLELKMLQVIKLNIKNHSGFIIAKFQEELCSLKSNMFKYYDTAVRIGDEQLSIITKHEHYFEYNRAAINKLAYEIVDIFGTKLIDCCEITNNIGVNSILIHMIDRIFHILKKFNIEAEAPDEIYYEIMVIIIEQLDSKEVNKKNN